MRILGFLRDIDWPFGVVLCAGMLIIFVMIYFPQKKHLESPKEIRLQGCEYIVNETYMDYPVLTHKGNCTNSIHRWNQ